MSDRDVYADLDRTLRVSDQSCTAYAVLRDRYRRRSTALDLTILLLSAWLAAMIWVQPNIADQLTPLHLSRDLWLGLLSIAAFCFSLIQLQVDWKSRANTYHQGVSVLGTYVKELRPLRASVDPGKIAASLERYQAITEPLEPIPEADFLKLKQLHLKKVRLSRLLDKRPGASLWLLRWRLWLIDNREAPDDCAGTRGAVERI